MLRTGRTAVCGTLALPAQAQAERVPAVVLLGGSGPTDRDGTVGAWRPLRDIAWGLAAHGIASFRFDERTTDRPPPSIATVEDEVLEDARAAVALLRSDAHVDSRAIYVVGHSLGGMLVPRLLTTTSGMRGGVLLAANSQPLHRVLSDQLQRMVALGNTAYTGVAQAAAELARAIEAGTLRNGTYLGAPATYWTDLAAYDPTETARAAGQPLLLIFGKDDTQLSNADIRLWRDALTDVSRTMIQHYDGLDHFLMSATPFASMQDTRQVDARVIRAIAEWIHALDRVRDL